MQAVAVNFILVEAEQWLVYILSHIIQLALPLAWLTFWVSSRVLAFNITGNFTLIMITIVHTYARGPFTVKFARVRRSTETRKGFRASR